MRADPPFFLILFLSVMASSLGLAFSGAALAGDFPGPVKGQVIRVIDGDSLEVTVMIWLDVTLTTKVRLANIDTPEIWRPACAKERAAGEQAKALVERFVGFGQVQLFDIHYGKYAGRVVARVENAKGEDLSQALLAAGFGEKDWCA